MSKKKKRKSKNTITDLIIEYFENNPKKSFNYKQLAKILQINDAGGKKQVMKSLLSLEQQDFLTQERRGKFRLSAHISKLLKTSTNLVEGTCDMKSTGKAYIITEEFDEDILIAPNNTNTALNDDIVKVQLMPKRKGKKLEGKIVEIVKRARNSYVGTLQVSNRYAFLVPDNPAMPVDLFIHKEDLKGGKNGQKAIATISDWPQNAKNPFGKILKVIGTPGENDVEMCSILAEYELPLEFPDTVLKAADKIPEEIGKKEISKRKDFRNVTTITIDPFNAKDFDDAISIKKLADNKWEIGVHIADVSHYVTPGSTIDEEAYNRATSVYLVDRVVPMLPEKLSNKVCSLRPNEDKLCFSAVFEMNETGRIFKQWFGRTIINSDRRFNYEEAQEIIESNKGDFAEEISILHDVAQKLRERRMKNGSMAFERQEVKFHIDEKGKPIGVKIVEHNESHQLIEEYMLLANKRVAEFIGKPKGEDKPKTFIYRIHDDPNPEKLEALSDFVSKFGYKIRTSSRKATASSMNQLLHEITGKGEQNLIETLAIRSMAKAIYSTTNIGHYGLAFEHYSHFTSPIRRYPDLMVHRLLQRYLDGKSSAEKEEYEEKCMHSSDMEKRAADAERDSIKYKQVEFMSDKLGKVFDGVISGVSKWGIFVEIKENKCEGMIRMTDLDDDFYYLDEENHMVIGQRYGQEFRLGDEIKISVKKADLSKKQLDFNLETSAEVE